MKEVKLKRVAGPNLKIPFHNYIQSPIGLVPKSGEQQTRLIFHLLFMFKKEELDSVNAHAPKVKCSVTYRDLDYAVRTFLKLMKSVEEEDSIDASWSELSKRWKRKFNNHKNIKIIYSGKSDLKSTFRILCLSPDCWMWLVMKARDPQTGTWCFFVDKCLPFGSSMSCALFQRFSDALCHLIEFKLGVSQ